MPKPVIFVPGLPGSTLVDRHQSRTLFVDPAALVGRERARTLARLSAPEDPAVPDGVVHAGPVRHRVRLLWLDLGKEAQSLYDLLAELGYDIFDADHVQPIGWDWRLPVYHPVVQTELKQAIQLLHQRRGQPVVILCHSTGGLVVRWCLEALARDDPATLTMVEQVVAMGVPWAGTLKPVRYIGPGEAMAGGFIGRDDARRVLGSAHAAYDLMPIGPQAGDEAVPPLFLNARGQVVSPRVDRRWLRPEFHSRAERSEAAIGTRTSALRLGGRVLPITNIVGYGRKTDTEARLRPGGETVHLTATKAGDGTIPQASAAWLTGPGVRTFHVPYGAYPQGPVSGKHSQLWGAPPVRELIAQILEGEARTPYTWAALDPDDVYSGRRRVTIHVVGLDPDGQPLEDARAYTLAVGPRRRGADHTLDDWGRAEIEYDRARASATMNRHHVPVELAWSYQGREWKRRFEILFIG
jgi:hypothetical protein